MSEVKVNKISPRTACGTVTLGDSGDTFTIPSGATITNNGTQTGFGASGAVTYDTTPKTATFTAASGSGYFCDTSGGAFTVNLPAGAAGSIVTLVDYTRTFGTNALAIAPDGSEKVGGVAADTALEVNGQSATFVYVDSTEGWINTQDTQTTTTGQLFVVASGGNQPTATGCIVCTNYKFHKFTGPGTLCVSSAGNAAGSNSVDYLVVAGGAGGGLGPGPSDRGGGGGAGGYRESSGAASGNYTASPLGCGVSALSVTASPYSITIGGGGAGAAPGCAGSNSVFSTITSAGGGGGGGGPSGNNLSAPGGSGGGGGGGCGTAKSGGLGNVPSVSPPQGNDGGEGGGPACTSKGGGGGGATVAGSPVPAGLDGGDGGTTSISGSPVAYAGGGGGSGGSCGGAGGGGGPAANGTVNTGGGGGGGMPAGIGAGGSGIVYIRYRFQ